MVVLNIDVVLKSVLRSYIYIVLANMKQKEIVNVELVFCVQALVSNAFI